MSNPRALPAAGRAGRLLTLLLVAVMLLAPPLGAGQERIRLPDISRIDSHDPLHDDVAIEGRRIHRELRKVLPLVDDPELMQWLRTVGNRITRQLPDARYPFYFSIVDDPSINAFATRGGVVAVNAGLILNVDSEDELAAVIAHELAHVSQKHIERMQARSASGSLMTGLGILATMIAAAYDPTIAQAALMSTIAFQGQQQLAYSRQMETEADRIGLRLLTAAGYDPSAMGSFLAKLERFSSSENEEIIAWLRTHPLTRERVSNVLELARRMPTASRNRNPDFLYAREKIRALTAKNSSDYPIPDIDDPHVAKYAQAWKLARRLQFEDAVELLKDERSLQATLARARWLNDDRRFDEAVALLQPLLDIYPRSEPIAMLLTEALLGAGDGQRAWRVISAVPVSEHNSLGFYDLKARAADAAGRRGEGYRALAQKALRIGAIAQSRALLERALKVLELSEIEKARLEYELSQLDDEAEEP